MSQLSYTMFQDVLFPSEEDSSKASQSTLMLEKIFRFAPNLESSLKDMPLVVFDFETTGLDTNNDHIIEIGALKTVNGRILDEFSYLISSPVAISEVITGITGITPDMLLGKPPLEEVLPLFLQFIEGSILVAHNAEFDMAFLRSACLQSGIQINWPAFCTLKMARKILPELESKNLDTLAEFFGLTFEARHRSIGDCKVTSAVLQSLLSHEGVSLPDWRSVQPFAVHK